MASEQFSLCWDNFHKNMSSGMNSLLENEDLVDVTLAVEGKYLKAHKMVLSVCSPYFKELFKVNPCQHPIVFLKDVSYVAISDLLQFMYQGEVQVSQDNLTTFIKTAEALQIKGLTGDGNGSADVETEPVQEKPSIRHSEDYKPVPRPKKQAPAPIVTTTASKRPRLSVSSNDSQSAPAPVTKTEPISLPSTDSQPVQFKMEPYDQNQSVTIPDDTGDDNFGDDTLDDTAVDDTEDYSMMEGEEPQAGTSTDGAGEGQGESGGKQKLVVLGKVIINGYSYNTSYVTGTPPRRYLRCRDGRKFKCKARAIQNYTTAQIRLVNCHNHPPVENEDKIAAFLDELRASVRSNGTLKEIYDRVAEKHPEGAPCKPFDRIRSSMSRWRSRIKTPNKKSRHLSALLC
ncbi:protein tramtrack, alpha isoform-like isoform X2 [Sitophilus oryzae]|uniref:Protein tramtrack, alpha isoform-like isoform X2 n=1 Tax=Sitophilus oryzae TaxID=7048 RepID=A0A6J2XKK9_SITOR|nr:protein tramtrack, alpha isoform-like isoform X2 [Sitophilus oryzae]